MVQRPGFFRSSVIPFRLVFFMWLLYGTSVYYEVDLGFLGVFPRRWSTITGILTATMIHGDIVHLMSNTFPLLFLGWLLCFFYPQQATTVLWRSYALPYVFVWLLSPRLSYHLGASGMIYGLCAFLIVFGLLRGDLMSLLVSLVTVVMYGGIFYAVLPTDPHVSWETHLAGAAVGAYTAYRLGRTMD